jgi:drug/metabolite transporter (DMT)-like permease
VRTAGLVLGLCMVVVVTALGQDPGGVAAPLGVLWTIGGAVLTSFLLGQAKTLDTTVTNSPLVRKLQPAITLGGAYLAPWLATHVGGFTLDPSAFAVAPFATLATVLGAELAAIGHRTKGLH